MPHPAVFSRKLVIPQSAIDDNGHVNNVAYVQWMQDIAVQHYAAVGGTAPMQAAGATWVVHEHRITYLLPAFSGEELEIRTWVANIRKVRSLRKYEFVRTSDARLLVRGETGWVFVDTHSGRPVSIPTSVVAVFTLLPEG
jgi:acyl-CoA thioester hydrolase